LRNDLQVELDEHDYAKNPLSRGELEELFRGRDPRDFINPKSPAFKTLALKGKQLSEDQAIALMVREPNLLKRPLVIAGKKLIAGFDRDALREALT
jgi:arsenate reductase-like glutaredoxin family protein